MSSPSLSEISEDFLDKKARKTDNGIKTEVESVNVYPFTEEWWITIDCGEPFEEYVARIPLGETRKDALETIREIYQDFTELNQLTHSFIEIDLEADHKTSGGSPEATLELEIPVLINGYKGHLSGALRSGEYHIKENNDIEYIQSEVETEVLLYKSIKDSLERDKELFIKNIDPENERSLILEIGGFSVDEALDIRVELPDLNEIDNSPVSEFINSVGSGKIENLEQSTVYLYEKSSSEEVIGLDTRFGEYGVCSHKIEEESKGILGRIF